MMNKSHHDQDNAEIPLQALGTKLDRSFYSRETLIVARDLLGRCLVHWTPEGLAAGRITETEAYRGAADKAAHSYKGRTKRNAIMFGPGGFSYVYFIYGMYSCFNIVTRDVDQPEAVLIRALQPLIGLEDMRKRRGKSAIEHLCSGPGKLCQAMGLDFRNHNGIDLCSDHLYLTEGEPVSDACIQRTPRINIAYAEEAALYPWRFVIGQC